MTIPKNPKAMHGWFGYRHLPYAYGEKGFDLARAIVAVKLPKKEFFETIAMAEAIRKHIDPTQSLLEACCGHGLLGLLLATDPRLPEVTLLDQRFPPNLPRLRKVLEPYIEKAEQRLRLVETDIRSYSGFKGGTVVASHACGVATEMLLDVARTHEARFFIMPCCVTRTLAQRYGLSTPNENLDEINARRLERMASAGYDVTVLRIDNRITPWNTILVGWPRGQTPSPHGGLAEGPLPATLPPKLQLEDRSP